MERLLFDDAEVEQTDADKGRKGDREQRPRHQQSWPQRSVARAGPATEQRTNHKKRKKRKRNSNNGRNSHRKH